ncbi:MAG: ATP synthase F1 subunit epsilon [Anaerofustis stercorihominis]|nr:ATP synthase F1 subunit epsilon [Anaerofustis stercorihominis]
MSNKIKIKIITPERLFFDGEVDRYVVDAKGATGGFAVFTNHSPLTTEIGYGTITLINEEEERKATVFGGFALVQPYETIILVDVAEWPDELDIDRAMRAKERAEAEIAKSDSEFEMARISLMKALVRIDLANTADKMKK